MGDWLGSSVPVTGVDEPLEDTALDELETLLLRLEELTELDTLLLELADLPALDTLLLALEKLLVSN
ncbi:MAG: hypothetical protein AB7F79_11570 [Steroidobacteraceae bacterium]